MEEILGCLGLIALVIIFAVLGSLLTGVLVFFVWNLALAVLFGMPELTYFQAWLLGLGLSTVASLFRAAYTVNE